MAVGIARLRLGGIAHVESAGIAAYGEGATKEAVRVMREKYGVDISGHRPRDFAEVSLSEFDYVVGMDGYVQGHLISACQVRPDKLIRWDIGDPYLQGIDAYFDCASVIERHVRDVLGRLLSEEVHDLQADIARWKAEVDSGELRGTLLHGIASKAVDTFELRLQDLLRYYLLVCGIDYDRALGPRRKGKALQRLAMGDVVLSFKELGTELTERCRSLSPGAANMLKCRQLVTPALAEQLDELVQLRNRLHHRPHEYAKDIATLESNARRTLALIQTAVADALFSGVPVVREGKSDAQGDGPYT
jgi:protein-tyrosine-phosphatase